MTVKHLFPAVEPSLNLDFANSKKLDPRITFTRSSTGTYVDSNGLIKTAAANEARFDHDPVSGSSLGLLIEESRTNHCLYSQIDSTNWTQANLASLSASAVAAPDGGTCYDLTTDSGGPNSIRLTGTSSPVGTAALSVFARFPDTGFVLNLRIVATSGGVNCYADFNPATETFQLNNCTASFQKFSNDWYRLTIFSSTSSVAGAHEVRFGGAILGATYTSKTCQIWGAQLEAGSFPTSYIPTSGSTVTRSADVASMTGTNFSSWYNQGAGSFIATADRVDGLPASQFTVMTTNGFRLPEFLFTSSGTARIFNNLTGSYTSPTSLLKATFGCSFDGSGISRYVNGSGNSVVSTALVDTNTVLYLGNWLNNATLYRLSGHISRLTYYPFRLTDAQLQALTL